MKRAIILKELGNQYANASVDKGYEKALECYNAAIPLFEESNDMNNAMDTTLDKVNVFRRTRRFDEAQELIKELDKVILSQSESMDNSVAKVKIRSQLMLGLILGMGHRDKESKEASIPILKDAAEMAEEGGYVRLHATVLNASGLIKYQTAGDSIERLESGAKDLNQAFRLNIYIGDARSCFQQMRNLGLIHAKLSRLLEKPELLDQAIENFRRGEKFLFRLSRNRFMGELLEIRFRLGEALVAAKRFKEADPILIAVREKRVELGDWHNEARTLELLLKTASNKDDLLVRGRQVLDIYEDARTNETKQARFAKQPITATNGKQILKTAADLVKDCDEELSSKLESLIQIVFGEE